MNKKNNKRYQETEKRIVDSFLTLVNAGEEFDVNKLCTHAKINRSTFYAHFDNMDQFLEKMEDYIWNEFFYSLGPSIYSADYLWSREFFEKYLKYVSNHQEYFKYFMPRYLQHLRTQDSNIATGIYPIRGKNIKHSYAPIDPGRIWEVANRAKGSSAIDVQQEIFYSYFFLETGITMCIYRWLINGCQESPEDFCDFLMRIM